MPLAADAKESCLEAWLGKCEEQRLAGSQKQCPGCVPDVFLQDCATDSVFQLFQADVFHVADTLATQGLAIFQRVTSGDQPAFHGWMTSHPKERVTRDITGPVTVGLGMNLG